MTVASSTNSVDYTGNGSTTVFSFSFRIFAATDLVVTEADADGVETVLELNTDYTVTGVGSYSGGSITMATAPTSGYALNIRRVLPLTQDTDLRNQGQFFAETHEDVFDRLAMVNQQLQEQIDRSAKLPVTSTADADALVADLVRLADSADNIDTVAANIADVNTVAANIVDIQNAEENADAAAASATAAASSATAAASSASSASTSASNASTSASSASTSATNAASSASAASTSATAAASSATSAAGSATTATTQASNASTSATNAASSASSASTSATNAATSATSAASAQAAAEAAQSAAEAAEAAINGSYLGAQTSDPTLDLNGNPVTAGDWYFNTTTSVTRIYDGATWQNGAVSTAGFLLTANNLSDVANATTARTNLGLAIGTNVQAYDANLTSAANRGLFTKADPTVVAWTKTGAGTATTATAIYVDVNGSIKTIAASTSITMPTLTAGTDYAIWAKTDGTLEATSNHTSPPSANARKVGGFHYAPGGNATGTSGGNTTPQINEYSFWDLKFRPACIDPRGMTLVGGGFWMDIYLTGVDAITNGSSKYNVTMADGSSPPKVPTMFGGNGSTTYGSYTWFEAMELATSFGKQCPTQQEFMSAMYGTTEASSVGSDQGSTILNAAYTSKWGVIQSTGVLWVWGRDRGGAYNTGGWNANTESRGSEYNAPNAVLLGGDWGSGSVSGSRCSGWYSAASDSYGSVGSRFCCDHLQLD